jgi:hypothetical protein
MPASEAIMKHRVAILLLMLLPGIMLIGCDTTQPTTATGPAAPPAPPPPPGSAPPAAASAPAAPVATEAPPPPETKFGVFAGDVNDLAARPSSPPQQPAASAPAAAETERVKAEKGVGIKGRSLDQYEGALVTPAKAFFSAKERIVFDIQVPEALKLYKASEGEAPKSDAEFMEKIIRANQIKLPQLPPGHKYVYDPATEQLMVERPKRQ